MVSIAYCVLNAMSKLCHYKHRLYANQREEKLSSPWLHPRQNLGHYYPKVSNSFYERSNEKDPDLWLSDPYNKHLRYSNKPFESWENPRNPLLHNLSLKDLESKYFTINKKNFVDPMTGVYGHVYQDEEKSAHGCNTKNPSNFCSRTNEHFDDGHYSIYQGLLSNETSRNDFYSLKNKHPKTSAQKLYDYFNGSIKTKSHESSSFTFDNCLQNVCKNTDAENSTIQAKFLDNLARRHNIDYNRWKTDKDELWHSINNDSCEPRLIGSSHRSGNLDQEQYSLREFDHNVLKSRISVKNDKIMQKINLNQRHLSRQNLKWLLYHNYRGSSCERNCDLHLNYSSVQKYPCDLLKLEKRRDFNIIFDANELHTIADYNNSFLSPNTKRLVQVEKLSKKTESCKCSAC